MLLYLSKPRGLSLEILDASTAYLTHADKRKIRANHASRLSAVIEFTPNWKLVLLWPLALDTDTHQHKQQQDARCTMCFITFYGHKQET